MKRRHGWGGGGGRMLQAMQPCWEFTPPHHVFKKSLSGLSVRDLLKVWWPNNSQIWTWSTFFFLPIKRTPAPPHWLWRSIPHLARLSLYIFSGSDPWLDGGQQDEECWVKASGNSGYYFCLKVLVIKPGDPKQTSGKGWKVRCELRDQGPKGGGKRWNPESRSRGCLQKKSRKDTALKGVSK